MAYASRPWLTSESYVIPSRLVVSGWLEHAPFAAWLIDALRPRVFAELGTHNGFSYFAFCEAVKRTGSDTRCFALDSWEGDVHAGFYGEEIYQDVKAENAQYADFSTLLRGYFSDLVGEFEDGSIDLLHIDGRHHYEDVREDFEAYLPKLSDRAVVIFHDTEVHEREFGVYQLWAELADRYPSLNFRHGNGLGVIGVGTDLPPAMRAFFAQAAESDDQILTDYAELGSRVSLRFRNEEELAALRAEIDGLRTSEATYQHSAILLTSEVQALRSSTSWKLTAPVRWFSERVLGRPSS